MRKKPTLHQKCQLIISHFLSHINKISWPKEVKIAKSLLQGIPDHTFWLSLRPPKPITTLSYFKTEEGELLIQLSYKNQGIDLSSGRKRVTLDDNLGDKIGEDKEVKKKKPKTLMEFLNAKTEKRKDK